MKLSIKVLIAALVAVVIPALLMVTPSPEPARAQYPSPVGSVSLSGPRTAYVGRTVILIAYIRGLRGQPLSGRSVLFKIESEPGTDANLEGAKQVSKTTNFLGMAFARLFVGTTTGDLVVSATADGMQSQLTIRVIAFGVPMPRPGPWPFPRPFPKPFSQFYVGNAQPLPAGQTAQLAQAVVDDSLSMARLLMRSLLRRLLSHRSGLAP